MVVKQDRFSLSKVILQYFFTSMFRIIALLHHPAAFLSMLQCDFSQSVSSSHLSSLLYVL